MKVLLISLFQIEVNRIENWILYVCASTLLLGLKNLALHLYKIFRFLCVLFTFFRSLSFGIPDDHTFSVWCVRWNTPSTHCARFELCQWTNKKYGENAYAFHVPFGRSLCRMRSIFVFRRYWSVSFWLRNHSDRITLF